MRKIGYVLICLVFFGLGVVFDGLITRVPDEASTLSKMRILERELRKYHAQNGQLPKTIDELCKFSPRVENCRTNCWGKPIRYVVTSDSQVVLVTSGDGEVEFVRRFAVGDDGKNELKPLTPRQLFEMPLENLDRVDIGRMNLICARNVTRTELLDTAKYVAQLDEWAGIAKRLEQKYLPAYEKNAARYENSLAKFKAVTLALTIQQDLKCDYNMDLITSGAMNDIRSPRFFKNPDDVFITGLLKNRKGTCSSLPVLFVALGRRLNYPVFLAHTKGHLYCRWDDGKESFNIEMTGRGVDTPPDSYYKGAPFNPSEADIQNEGMLRNLTNRESLAVFLETSAVNREANGDMHLAFLLYSMALKLRPDSPVLRRMCDHAYRIAQSTPKP